MRKLIIGAGGCLTVAAFVAAERLHSTTADAFAIEQEAAFQAALDVRLTQSRATFVAETAALKDATDVAQERASALASAMQGLMTERDKLAGQLTTLQSDAEFAAQQLASVAAINSGMVQKVELQQASIAEKDTELDALRSRIDVLVEATENMPEAYPDNTDLLDEIASLSETLKARDEKIASLEVMIAAASDAGEVDDVRGAEFEKELEAARAEIAELTGAAAQQAEAAEARIAELTDTVEERDATVALLESQLNDRAASIEAPVAASVADAGQSEDLEGLSARLAELTERVSAQSEVIATLRMGFVDETASAEQMAQACFERANKIFEISQINFATGTASISQDSMMTLDHLRDLAIGCKSDDMFIEIGGHTDSYGSESENQTLSEARAKSVRDFLIARGIPADTMVAVGFGEAHPVAPNDTADGRAQNRRITFSWQMRDEEPGNVDG